MSIPGSTKMDVSILEFIPMGIRSPSSRGFMIAVVYSLNSISSLFCFVFHIELVFIVGLVSLIEV